MDERRWQAVAAAGARNVAEAVLVGSVHSLRGVVALTYVDQAIQAKLDERQNRLRIAADNGYKVPYHKLKSRKSPKVCKRVVQCCAINGGIFLFSLLLFNNLLLPLIKWTWLMVLPSRLAPVCEWVGSVLSVAFGTLWVVPLLVVTRFTNSLWWQDIADDLAFLHSGSSNLRSAVSSGGGGGAVTQSHNRSRRADGWSAGATAGVSGMLADVLFSTVIESLFLMQALLIGSLPLGIFSQLASTAHLSLLYSLYAFEYRWWQSGGRAAPLTVRLAAVERSWPYYLGFGLPVCLVSSIHHSTLVNGCVFSTLFPILILSAFEAVTPDTAAAAGGGGGLLPTTPSLPFFTPVLKLSNLIFSILKACTSPDRRPH